MKAILKFLLRLVLRLWYRVELQGFERLSELRTQRLLFIANHLSVLDGVLLYAFLPESPTFVVNTEIADRPLNKFLLRAADCISLSPHNPLGFKDLVQRLRKKRLAVLFPEGRVTTTGTTMKTYRGAVLLAERSEALVVPIGIDGLQYSGFNYLPEQRCRRPRVRLVMLDPVQLDPARGPRANLRHLEKLVNESAFSAYHHRRSLLEGLRDTAALRGRRRLLAEDAGGARLSYRDLYLRSRLLAGALRTALGEEPRVGLLLPSSCAALAAFYALHWLGRTPAMLNFTLGPEALLNGCRLAELRTVISSRTFVEKAGLEALAEQLQKEHRLLFLEDLRDSIPRPRALLQLLVGRLPGGMPRPPAKLPDVPAVILFTSGSEGLPKGVVISHANLLACFAQVRVLLDLRERDEIFCCLPLFHSFGLFLGMVLGPMAGVRVFFYPSPLHYRVIPEMIYERGSTILCSTNTFLHQYAKAAHPFDFHSLRYVVAGAEKLQESVRCTWLEKFGIRILQGYGVTESSPVIAVNSPLAHRAGSVGRLLPGMECYTRKMEGIEQGGSLVVRGPNIMSGYLLPERPGEIVAPETERGEGWYDTGDIVEIDADGFLQVRGRAKRFAKSGGEMISLGLVEELATACWPRARHLAAALPDPRRGESVYLLSEQRDPQRKDFRTLLQARGYSELHLPRAIWQVPELPLLASGKADYPAADRMAAELLAASREQTPTAQADAPRTEPEAGPGGAAKNLSEQRRP